MRGEVGSRTHDVLGGAVSRICKKPPAAFLSNPHLDYSPDLSLGWLVGWLVGCVILMHINLFVSFNAGSCYFEFFRSGFVWFDGILTIAVMNAKCHCKTYKQLHSKQISLIQV